MVVNKKTREIVCKDHEKGRRHDFRVLKQSKVRLHPETEVIVDTGYLGLGKIHARTQIPKKRSKKNPLTPEEKARNKAISKNRVLCENVIAALKRFKIISERYRNRRKRFGLRFSLIAGLYNANLFL